MQNDRIIAQKRERNARITGIAMSVALHAVRPRAGLFLRSEIHLSPAQEQSLPDRLQRRAGAVVQQLQGGQPQAEEVDPSVPSSWCRRANPPMRPDRQNLTPRRSRTTSATSKSPPCRRKSPPWTRAAFPGMAKKDTSSPHRTAAEASDSFKAGQANGNTDSGRTDGKPNAHVQGRNTVGNIPRPVYNVQESGIVVVNIWVDNYGNVVKAVPGGDGTTVLDKTLSAAARKAALETHFNMSADAPAMQEGTITYYFNLK